MRSLESSVEKEVEKNLRIERALEKRDKVYKAGGGAIQEREFEDLYSQERVEEDLEYVERMERKFEENATPEQKESNKLATIFEAMIYDQSERSNWLGNNAMTIKTSRYDDIKNGIDLIVEVPDKEKPTASHLALAVDVTFSDDLRDKMRKIKREIDSNKLATVKYFKSDFLDFRGEKSNIPKVVVGADYKTLENVIDLWKSEENEEYRKEYRKLLERHHIQFIILDEIMLQLHNYKEYARKRNKKSAFESYDKVIETVQDINGEKQELREEILADDNSKIENDKVFSAIKENLNKEFA